MKVDVVGYSQKPLTNYFSHNHKYWEILLNLTGSGTAYVDGKEYNFEPGTIMCIPPGIFHSKTPVTTFRDIYIITDAISLPSDNELAIFSDDTEKSIENLMFMAYRVFSKKDKNYASIVDNITTTILQFFLGWSKKPRNESVELFKNELIKNYTDPEFKISDASKSMFYCSDHFRRCFKQDTGVTPISYLNNLRIDQAKQLLIQKCFSGMSISEISYLSGFSDANYFSRLFKSKVGKTPFEFALRFDANSKK